MQESAVKKRARKRGDVFKRCGCAVRNWPSCPHPYYHTFKPKGRRQFKESLGVATKPEAIAKQRERKTELSATASDPRDHRATLDIVVEKYRAAHKIADTDYYSPILCDLKVRGPHGPVRLGNKRMADVTADDLLTAVECYRERRVDAGKAGGKVGVRKLAQTIRHLWNWAKHPKRGIVKASPFEGDDDLKALARPQASRDRRLEAGEEDRLLAAADQFTHDRIIAILDTSLRGHSLRLLQWQDVARNAEGEIAYLIVKPEKQKAGLRKKRPVTLRVKVSVRLREVLERRALGPDGAELPPEAHVFGTATGERVSEWFEDDRWRQTCEAAKITGLHFHDLRGEHASQMADAGVSIQKIQAVLAHGSATTTAGYLRNRVGATDDAYDQLEEWRRQRVVPIRTGIRPRDQRRSA
jgi:integrase